MIAMRELLVILEAFITKITIAFRALHGLDWNIEADIALNFLDNDGPLFFGKTIVINKILHLNLDLWLNSLIKSTVQFLI